ncbi:UNVERIFIED_CONTAM: hypothetical protein Sangu_2109400 [Sesamum angustifolium]|uniref:Uncharacterized protein n=1 Tax=Sesamum angustifolium TaxID=2727405 RepID=A0AAW2LJT0_9LAMI
MDLRPRFPTFSALRPRPRPRLPLLLLQFLRLHLQHHQGLLRRKEGLWGSELFVHGHDGEESTRGAGGLFESRGHIVELVSEARRRWRGGEEVACRVVRVCVDGWGLGWRRVLPLRVWVAASMWLGLRVSGEKSWEVLKRVEEISGVPAKMIGAAEARLERGLRGRQRRGVEVLEEGWAEC